MSKLWNVVKKIGVVVGKSGKTVAGSWVVISALPWDSILAWAANNPNRKVQIAAGAGVLVIGTIDRLRKMYNEYKVG